MLPPRPYAVSLALLAIAVAASASSHLPNYQGCINETARALPYCDQNLTHEQRVQDLLSRLTLKEKILLISPDPALGSTCNMHTNGIERLGVPPYMWLVETNTAVAASCLRPGQCATNFAGPEGLGASFNRTAWFLKGDVISTELRALSNDDWHRGTGAADYIGLDGFGPNINIARDPRFGRASELPGEDPYLSGQYAAQYVKGIQQLDEHGYMKMIAYLKHFDAYSLEANRGHDNHNISTFDFFDTYLPAYETAFSEGQASGVMCSYNAENGHPSCANDWLLNTVMRKQWNAPDAVVMTDCGAVNNMMGAPVYAATPELAVAMTINNGTDLEAGTNLWLDHLENATHLGLVKEETIDAAVRRTQLQLMRAGHYDPPSDVSWTKINTDVVNSTRHQQINYESALQSFVLLKNDGILPLTQGTKLAVLGPQAVATEGLLSDYHGDELCFNKTWDCIPTIAAKLKDLNPTTTVAKGVDVNSTDASGIPDAIAAAKQADVVILALGIDNTIEHEGVDRTDITLPGLQFHFAQEVLALGKKTILVFTNGGALAIDGLIEQPNAIAEIFNPGPEGARALAATLFGQENKWGKLPITMYTKDFINQQSMLNFDMTAAPGRTYRYYTGRVLYPFGFGLSMTTFTTSCTEGKSQRYQCTVTNTGNMDGDEIILLFHRVGDEIRQKVDHPVPLRRLVGFERVSVPKGDSRTLEFTVDESAYTLVNRQGEREIYSGEHMLDFTNGLQGTDLDQTTTFRVIRK